MRDLYIPPEGAMQFEITHPDTKYRGENIWVFPQEVDWNALAFKNWECGCNKRYIVLPESISDNLLSAIRTDVNSRTDANSIVICECVGRIIE